MEAELKPIEVHLTAEQKARQIRVWQFKDAPQELRAMSNHGGDEDWVAVVPAVLSNVYIPWLEADSGSFGVCDIQEIFGEDGSRVYIGAHA